MYLLLLLLETIKDFSKVGMSFYIPTRNIKEFKMFFVCSNVILSVILISAIAEDV